MVIGLTLTYTEDFMEEDGQMIDVHKFHNKVQAIKY